MKSFLYRNLTFDTVDALSHLNSVQQVGPALRAALAKIGFTALGLAGLPAPSDGANPLILTESTPDGLRDCYIEEQLYLVDHIAAHARTALEPFRFDEAPYEGTRTPGQKRFMQTLDTFSVSRGLVVPIGRPAGIPFCVWMAGENPDLHDDAKQTAQLIALFAASKALALARSPAGRQRASKLTPQEREVLQWISVGKTSWEIGAIKGLSEGAINKAIAGAMTKLEAVTRTQAVVNAIRVGEIDF